jgi:hypothetical protein
MKTSVFSMILISFGITMGSYAQTNHTQTYDLVYQFHEAWNNEDLEAMKALLDEDGEKLDKQWHNDYVYFFRREEQGQWKLQMLLYHE